MAAGTLTLRTVTHGCSRAAAGASWTEFCTRAVQDMSAHQPSRAVRRWSSRRAAIAWSISALALVASGAGLVYATARELHYLTRVNLPTPPEVKADVVVTHAADALGRRASFRILLFTDEFRWRINSHDELDATPERPNFTPEMKAVLNSAEEIIAIGASSEELPAGLTAAEGRIAEERRAARRAERIALWVREVVSKPILVRKLNVGHHTPTPGGRGSAADTSDQRRVVIVLVLEREDGVNMDQALRVAMARESLNAPIFEALLTRYSLSSGQAFTWVP